MRKREEKEGRGRESLRKVKTNRVGEDGAARKGCREETNRLKGKGKS